MKQTQGQGDGVTRVVIELLGARFASREGERCRSHRHMPPVLPTACMSGSVALVNSIMDAYDAQDKDDVTKRLSSIKDSDGGTAMHRLATMMSNREHLPALAQRLLKYLGMNDKNKNGKTALDILRGCQSAEIIAQVEALTM